jgi:hypothetical protein
MQSDPPIHRPIETGKRDSYPDSFDDKLIYRLELTDQTAKILALCHQRICPNRGQ